MGGKPEWYALPPSARRKLVQLLTENAPPGEIVAFVAAHSPRGARSGASICRLAGKLGLPRPPRLARFKANGSGPDLGARVRWTPSMVTALRGLADDSSPPPTGPEFVAAFASSAGVRLSGTALYMKARKEGIALSGIKGLRETPLPPPLASTPSVAKACAIEEALSRYDRLVTGRAQLSVEEEIELLSQPLL